MGGGDRACGGQKGSGDVLIDSSLARRDASQFSASYISIINVVHVDYEMTHGFILLIQLLSHAPEASRE